MLAVFNGTAHPLRNFTVPDWRQRSSASCRARCRQTSDEKARGSLWWGEHIKTNAKLRVSIRTDRKQLLSLYEGPRQILQCTVDHFESFDQCAEVLIGIAERYATGHLEANDLQRERDAQMVPRGIAAPSRGKKFAANQMPSSSQHKRKAEDSCHGHVRLDEWSLRWKRTHGFECLVAHCTRHPQNRKHALHECHADTTSTLQPTPCCCFSRRHLQRGANKEIAFFRSQLSVEQKVNCLHILYNGVLGPLPQACIGRASWHDRDTTDKTKAHQHNARRVQRRESRTSTRT